MGDDLGDGERLAGQGTVMTKVKGELRRTEVVRSTVSGCQDPLVT